MEVFALIVGIVLFLVSIALNVYLLFKIRKSKPQKQDSYEVQELLHDLTAGVGLVQIKRIAPANVMIRSPRDY